MLPNQGHDHEDVYKTLFMNSLYHHLVFNLCLNPTLKGLACFHLQLLYFFADNPVFSKLRIIQIYVTYQNYMIKEKAEGRSFQVVFHH